MRCCRTGARACSRWSLDFPNCLRSLRLAISVPRSTPPLGIRRAQSPAPTDAQPADSQCALATVVLLVFVIVGFVRGLEASLRVSGEPDVVLVYSIGAEGNIENSAVEANAPDILTASVDGIQRRFEVLHVSPELYLGTRVAAGDDDFASLGLVRGVTSPRAARAP